MELCSHKHDEVCYEVACCPACVIRDELEDKLETVKQELRETQEERDGLLG